MTTALVRAGQKLAGGSSWVVLAAALAVQVLAFDLEISLYDEGIILVGADQVAGGSVPYRNFWTMYGPGQFYLASWLFSVFGTTDLAVRAIGLAAKAAITTLAYVMIARLAGRRLAPAGALIVLGTLIAVRFDAFPVFPALAFAMASILLLERGLAHRRGEVLAAGICTGIATCFRHDLGAYTAVAAVLAVFTVHLIGIPRSQLGERTLLAARNFLPYVTGVLLVVAPVAAALLHAVPALDLYKDLIETPAEIYPAFRALPFPGLSVLRAIPGHPFQIIQFSVYVPFLVCAVVLATEASRVPGIRARGDFAEESVQDGWFLVLLIALTCLLMTLKGGVRVSITHMVQSLVLSVVLGLGSAARQSWRARSGKPLVFFSLAPAAALMLLLGDVGFDALKNGVQALWASEVNLVSRCMRPVLPRLRCVSADADYLQAARVVMAQTSDSDSIYVGTTRHDKLFINAVAFYFMVGRKPATKWYELHPGIQTQARVQEDMIAEMHSAPPKFVVLDSRWDGAEEPNASRVPSGNSLLDKYIEDHYVESNRFGTVRLLVRK